MNDYEKIKIIESVLNIYVKKTKLRRRINQLSDYYSHEIFVGLLKKKYTIFDNCGCGTPIHSIIHYSSLKILWFFRAERHHSDGADYEQKIMNKRAQSLSIRIDNKMSISFKNFLR